MSHLTRSLYAHNATLNNTTNVSDCKRQILTSWFSLMNRWREQVNPHKAADWRHNIYGKPLISFLFHGGIKLTSGCRLPVMDDVRLPLTAPQRHWLVTESMPPAASHWLEHKSGGGQGCGVHGVRVTAEREGRARWRSVPTRFFPSWKRFLFSAWERQSNTISL